MANQTKWPGALYLIYFADRIAGHELFDSAFARTGRGFDDPAYVRAGEMIQELVQRNAFPEGFNGLNYDTGQARALLYSGKAAMMLMTSGFISNMRDEAPEFEEKLDIFNFPAVEGRRRSVERCWRSKPGLFRRCQQQASGTGSGVGQVLDQCGSGARVHEHYGQNFRCARCCER